MEKNKFRTSNALSFLALIVVAAAVATPFVLDNPSFIARMKRFEFNIPLPRSNSILPVSNHMSYTVIGTGVGEIRKYFWAEAGKTISLHYSTRFENHEDFDLVVNPLGKKADELFRATVDTNLQDEVTELTAPASGFYQVTAVPHGFIGEINIWWTVK